MFRPAALRPALRSRLPRESRRLASSSSENAQKKAQEFLSSAQQYGSQGFASAKKFLGPVGDKLGNALGSYREPLTYNLSVARELLKQIYVAERLQPPTSVEAVTQAYNTLWTYARNPQYWRQVVRSGEWQKLAIYGLEAYGIFKIGEILGRRHLIGYDLH